MIKVAIVQNCLGEMGFMEREGKAGARRVFREVNGALEYMPEDDWHGLGWKRGRSYGHVFPPSELSLA